MNASQKTYRKLGCIIVVIAVALFVVAEIAHFIGTRRVPREIPLGDLLEAQADALGLEWTIDADDDLIDTNTNSTSGAWTYWTGFNNSDWRYRASLEFHTFRSPARAKSRLSPSPMAVNVKKQGNLPQGWIYFPPHADRFILDCTPEPVPEGCYVLLVYQEYSFVFGIDVAGAMSLEDLQRFLQATDDFMAEFLSSTKLERGRRHVPTPAELGL